MAPNTMLNDVMSNLQSRSRPLSLSLSGNFIYIAQKTFYEPLMLMASSQLVLSHMNYTYKIGVTARSKPPGIAPRNTALVSAFEIGRE